MYAEKLDDSTLPPATKDERRFTPDKDELLTNLIIKNMSDQGKPKWKEIMVQANLQFGCRIPPTDYYNRYHNFLKKKIFKAQNDIQGITNQPYRRPKANKKRQNRTKNQYNALRQQIAPIQAYSRNDGYEIPVTTVPIHFVEKSQQMLNEDQYSNFIDLIQVHGMNITKIANQLHKKPQVIDRAIIKILKSTIRDLLNVSSQKLSIPLIKIDKMNKIIHQITRLWNWDQFKLKYNLIQIFKEKYKKRGIQAIPKQFFINTFLHLKECLQKIGEINFEVDPKSKHSQEMFRYWSHDVEEKLFEFLVKIGKVYAAQEVGYNKQIMTDEMFEEIQTLMQDYYHCFSDELCFTKIRLRVKTMISSGIRKLFDLEKARCPDPQAVQSSIKIQNLIEGDTDTFSEAKQDSKKTNRRKSRNIIQIKANIFGEKNHIGSFSTVDLAKRLLLTSSKIVFALLLKLIKLHIDKILPTSQLQELMVFMKLYCTNALENVLMTYNFCENKIKLDNSPIKEEQQTNVNHARHHIKAEDDHASNLVRQEIGFDMDWFDDDYQIKDGDKNEQSRTCAQKQLKNQNGNQHKLKSIPLQMSRPTKLGTILNEKGQKDNMQRDKNGGPLKTKRKYKKRQLSKKSEKNKQDKSSISNIPAKHQNEKASPILQPSKKNGHSQKQSDIADDYQWPQSYSKIQQKNQKNNQHLQSNQQTKIQEQYKEIRLTLDDDSFQNINLNLSQPQSQMSRKKHKDTITKIEEKQPIYKIQTNKQQENLKNNVNWQQRKQIKIQQYENDFDEYFQFLQEDPLY